MSSSHFKPSADTDVYDTRPHGLYHQLTCCVTLPTTMTRLHTEYEVNYITHSRVCHMFELNKYYTP